MNIKKILIAVCIAACVLCFVFTFGMMIKLNKSIDALKTEINTLQEDYDNLSDNVDRKIAEAAPLSVGEINIFKHNLDFLNEIYGFSSNWSGVIANQCHTLKRNGKMESSKIIRAIKHNNSKGYTDCMEIITEDEEHYWFEYYGENSIAVIYKGAQRETVLYAVIQ